MYCLFCDVPCIVCVYMCTEQLPPGGYPTAVKYIIYHKIKQNPSHAYVTKTAFNADILMHSSDIFGASGLISYHSLLQFLINVCLQM